MTLRGSCGRSDLPRSPATSRESNVPDVADVRPARPRHYDDLRVLARRIDPADFPELAGTGSRREAANGLRTGRSERERPVSAPSNRYNKSSLLPGNHDRRAGHRRARPREPEIRSPCRTITSPNRRLPTLPLFHPPTEGIETVVLTRRETLPDRRTPIAGVAEVAGTSNRLLILARTLASSTFRARWPRWPSNETTSGRS